MLERAANMSFPLQVTADFDVAVEEAGKVGFGGIPLGAPVFVDGEAEADRIDFLSHRIVSVKI